MRPEIKAELERLARQGRRKGEWLSLSRTAATLLEKGVQGTIDMQYGALLRPVIEMELKKGLLAYSNRLANISFNSFNSAEQTRILVIQLLSYLLGDQNDILPGLVAQSQKEALKNLKAHFPDGEEDEAEKQND